MEDFTLGSFEEFKTFQPVSQNSNNPSNSRDMLKKEWQRNHLHGEYCSIVRKILYFVKELSPILPMHIMSFSSILTVLKRITGVHWGVYWVSSEMTSETEAQMSPPM
jgi:hypothetical protein